MRSLIKISFGSFKETERERGCKRVCAFSFISASYLWIGVRESLKIFYNFWVIKGKRPTYTTLVYWNFENCQSMLPYHRLSAILHFRPIAKDWPHPSRPALNSLFSFQHLLSQPEMILESTVYSLLHRPLRTRRNLDQSSQIPEQLP